MSKVEDTVRSLIEKEMKALELMPIGAEYEQAIEVIHEQVHKNGGKLVTTGMGKAGQIAHNIATTFASTGTPAFFIHPSEAQHGDLGAIESNDALLVISNSGKTNEVIDFIALANRLHDRETPVVAITGNKDSEMAKYSDVVLHTGNPPENCPLGMTPTTSTTVMNVIGNILVYLMMEKINFTKEKYALRHHGGYLGTRARKR